MITMKNMPYAIACGVRKIHKCSLCPSASVNIFLLIVLSSGCRNKASISRKNFIHQATAESLEA